jgi:hypothetical protein
LAYRVRSAAGRGGALVLARSIDGGITFTEIGRWSKERFGAESLERPALVHHGDSWSLYVSCATPGTKHWRIDLLRADTLDGLLTVRPSTPFPGDDALAVKDPVIRVVDGRWFGWICCHPLTEPGAEDRMTSRLAISADGIDWVWRDEVLTGRPGRWDARGARITAVFDDAPAFARRTVYYDGRASAAENFHERTGIAGAEQEDVLAPTGEPVADVRYLDLLPLPGGGVRLYYEAPLPDGSHELRTEFVG